MIPVRSLRDALALAYLDGMDRKAREAAERAAAPPVAVCPVYNLATEWCAHCRRTGG